jgi:hypothetical protein
MKDENTKLSRRNFLAAIGAGGAAGAAALAATAAQGIAGHRQGGRGRAPRGRRPGA